MLYNYFGILWDSHGGKIICVDTIQRLNRIPFQKSVKKLRNILDIKDRWVLEWKKEKGRRIGRQKGVTGRKRKAKAGEKKGRNVTLSRQGKANNNYLFLSESDILGLIASSAGCNAPVHISVIKTDMSLSHSSYHTAPVKADDRKLDKADWQSHEIPVVKCKIMNIGKVFISDLFQTCILNDYKYVMLALF